MPNQAPVELISWTTGGRSLHKQRDSPCIPEDLVSLLCKENRISQVFVFFFFFPLAALLSVSDLSSPLGLVTQSCPILCNPMDCGTPGLPVHHQLPEFAQTHVH